MGTNFYVREGTCRTCHQAKQTLHIGKRSGGWKFTWRGHENHVPVLRSKKEWFEFLCDPANVIVDEYDEVIGVAQFIDMVDAWDADPKNKRTHYAYLREPENMAKFSPREKDTWLDPEGFNFVGTEFG